MPKNFKDTGRQKEIPPSNTSHSVDTHKLTGTSGVDYTKQNQTVAKLNEIAQIGFKYGFESQTAFHLFNEIAGIKEANDFNKLDVSKDDEFRLSQLEFLYQQRKQELRPIEELQKQDFNTFLQQMEPKAAQELYTKVNEHIKNTNEIYHLTSDIHEDKIKDFDAIQEEIVLTEQEIQRFETSIQVHAPGKPALEKRIRDLSGSLERLNYPSYDYGSLDDRNKLQSQLKVLETQLKQYEGLDKGLEEIQTVSSEFKAYKIIVRKDANRFHKNILEYQQDIETSTVLKNLIEQHLLQSTDISLINVESPKLGSNPMEIDTETLSGQGEIKTETSNAENSRDSDTQMILDEDSQGIENNVLSPARSEMSIETAYYSDGGRKWVRHKENIFGFTHIPQFESAMASEAALQG